MHTQRMTLQEFILQSCKAKNLNGWIGENRTNQEQNVRASKFHEKHSNWEEASSKTSNKRISVLGKGNTHTDKMKLNNSDTKS